MSGLPRSGKRRISRFANWVVKGSTAQRAGLKKYDIIVEIDGRSGTGHNITRAKRENDYGEAVSFEILRKGKKMTLSIPIGEEH